MASIQATNMLPKVLQNLILDFLVGSVAYHKANYQIVMKHILMPIDDAENMTQRILDNIHRGGMLGQLPSNLHTYRNPLRSRSAQINIQNDYIDDPTDAYFLDDYTGLDLDDYTGLDPDDYTGLDPDNYIDEYFLDGYTGLDPDDTLI